MIKNLTKNKVLTKHKKYCQDIFSKGFGLMFSQKKDDYALVFFFKNEQIIPLTMLFVFYKIDVIWLDKNKKVVETATLKPFQLNYTPKHKAKYVVELPFGKIADARIELRDKIEF